jgi:hypothetical protein
MLCSPWERGRPGCLAWLLDAEHQQAQAGKTRNLRVSYYFLFRLVLFFLAIEKIDSSK